MLQLIILHYIACITEEMISLLVKSKTADTPKCEVVDGRELKSRHRGEISTIPSTRTTSITGLLVSPQTFSVVAYSCAQILDMLLLRHRRIGKSSILFKIVLILMSFHF